SIVVLSTVILAVPTRAQVQEPNQRSQRQGQSGAKVYKAQVTPHWFANNARFWYRNDLRGGCKEFIVVDAERGTREPVFDHQKLAAALSKAAGKEYRASALPFDNIEFIENGKAIRFDVTGSTWNCNLASYECSRAQTASSPGPSEISARQESNKEEPDSPMY